MTNFEPEPNRFKKFLNMAFIFKKNNYFSKNHIYNFEKIKLNQKQLLKLKLDTRFNELISQKDKDKIIIILKRGYEINSEQALNLMHREFENSIILDAVIKEYHLSIKNNLSSEIELELEQANKFERLNHTIYKEKVLSNFANKYFSIWRYVNQAEILEDSNYAVTFLNDCNRLKDIFENTAFTLKPEIKEQFIKVLELYIAHIKERHKDTINEKFIEELDNYSIVFDSFDKVKTNITIGMLENIKKFNENDLPKDAQIRVKEITKIANELTVDTLNIEQILEFNNIYKKRFFQVLEEYVSISPLYREKLKHHNENPDILLVESLDDIKNKLDSLFDVIQNDKHNRQKITHQYLKNI